MDCPVSAQYQPALACFSAQNQHRILHYLAGLAARQYADTTLSAVVTTLNALIRHLPRRRQVVLTDDITQTTAHESSIAPAKFDVDESQETYTTPYLILNFGNSPARDISIYPTTFVDGVPQERGEPLSVTMLFKISVNS